MSKTSRPAVRDTAQCGHASVSRNREYYLRNKERLIEYQKERRKNPEVKKYVSEYKKQYHIKNRDKIIARSKLYYEANREKKLVYGKKWRENNRSKHRVYSKTYRLKLRNAAFEHYGGSICVCCHEDMVGFLTIDHMNGNGNIHRRAIRTNGGHGFYQWLKNNNYPPGFQVLCYNCNMAKGVYGHCPHHPPQNTIMPL